MKATEKIKRNDSELEKAYSKCLNDAEELELSKIKVM